MRELQKRRVTPRWGYLAAMSRENVELIRRLWKAVERGDMDAVFSSYDPAIVWENQTGGPIELHGTYHGHEGVRQWFRQWLQSFENFQPHAEEYHELDEGHVLVLTRLSGRGKTSGVEVQMPRWNLYEIRNGLVKRVSIFESHACTAQRTTETCS